MSSYLRDLCALKAAGERYTGGCGISPVVRRYSFLTLTMTLTDRPPTADLIDLHLEEYFVYA